MNPYYGKGANGHSKKRPGGSHVRTSDGGKVGRKPVSAPPGHRHGGIPGGAKKRTALMKKKGSKNYKSKERAMMPEHGAQVPGNRAEVELQNLVRGNQEYA